MDILIPLGSATAWQDNELRFTLRSIEKHLKDYQDIYIIGEKPEWLTGVIHIPFKEVNLTSIREKNICDKVLRGCELPELSDNFLFFNDDHFLLQGVAAKDFPNYHSGQLTERFATVPSINPYFKTIRNTISALAGLDKLNYDTHCPMVFNKSAFVGVMTAYDWHRHYGYCMKSLYGNTMNVKGTKISDCKINARLNWEQIQITISGRPFFSVGNAGLTDDMKLLLQGRYPHPSKYEISK